MRRASDSTKGKSGGDAILLIWRRGAAAALDRSPLNWSDAGVDAEGIETSVRSRCSATSNTS